LRDQQFYDALVEIAKRWRFHPATLDGRPVRSAIRIEVATNLASDTLPEMLEWIYIHSADADSLHGRWVNLPVPPQLSPQDQHLVLVESLAELERIGLVPSDVELCAVFLRVSVEPPIDRLVSDPNCVRRPGPFRLRIDRMYPQSTGKAVAFLAGDLASGSPYADGSDYNVGWAARCIVFYAQDDSRITQCSHRGVSRELSAPLFDEAPPR
jgi:hypothetical protein